MKNYIFTFFAIVALQFSSIAQTATAPTAGTGTYYDPYQIATLENLYWLSQNPAEWSYKYFIQTANIDASASSGWDAGAGWTPIGNNTTNFSGYYYGQGYSVNGIYIYRPTTDFVGLFGYVSERIYDLGVTNVSVVGKDNVGGIAGSMDGYIENSFSSGEVTGNDRVGGVTGSNYDGNRYLQINYCYSTCNVSGHSGVGGITGRNRSAKINNCYSTGDVTGNGTYTGFTSGVGGLIGINSAANVNNSYCIGNVSGITNVGGFVGQNEYTTDTINNCYCRGNVTLLSGSSENIGGFVGNNSNSAAIYYSYTTSNVIGTSFTNKGFVGLNSTGVFINNFWDDDVSSQTTAIGATAKTTAEMKTQTTFTNAGWDFTGETVNGTNDYWTINAIQNDGYPYFNKLVEVIATSGITGPIKYYNLRLAFVAINTGLHQGAITIKINGNINETKSAFLNASGIGSANYSSVLIYPTLSGLSITGISDPPLIDLIGADNVTIDGRVNQIGGIDLTISNGGSGSAIEFINSAENNVIKYCTIKAKSNLTGYGVINFDEANSGNGNSGNLIDHCNLTQNTKICTQIIYSRGSLGFENKNNTISNCNFINIFRPNSSSYGINLYYNNSDWTITSNRFYETAPFVPSGDYGYYFIKVSSASGNNFIINDNIIGGNAPDNSGMFTVNSIYANQIYGILLNVGTTTASSVQNNTIKNINYTSTSTTPFHGIYVNSGNVNIGNVIGNTIGSSIGTGSITITNSTANANSYGIYCNSPDAVTVANNNIGAITTIGSSTFAHSFSGIYKNVTPGTTIIRNNTIGSATTANSIHASSDAASNAQSVYGIYVLGTGTNTISSNTIANLTNATSFASGSVSGIYYGGSTIASSVNGNFIHSLSSPSANPSINGIYHGAGNATYSNNIINLGTGITNGNSFIGINGAGSNTLNLYHNTVYIGGTASGTTANTFALSNIGTNTRVYKNNIFSNSRSGGSTGKHYAASISSAINLTSDYNDYYAPNGVLGLFSGTDKTTLLSWASVVGGNTNSKNANPGFASAGGTVAANYLPSESSLAGVTGTGITTDYAGVLNSRSITYPAMGAWEYPVVACSAPSISSQSTTTQTKCLNGTFSAITVTASGTGLNYQWYSNTVASTSGVGVINLGSANGAQTNSYTPQTTTSGTLYYYCVVTGTCGTATSLVSEAFVVNTPPTAPTSITGTTTICGGNTTMLTASGGSEGSGCTYQWGTGSTVGSNIISGASSASYTTTALTGNTTYWVRRVGASPCSNTTSGVTQLIAVDIVSASYVSADTSLCISGNNFSFTNTSTGVNYKWDFGDGQTSTSTSPSHSYASAGTFSVKLVASSLLNCKDSITKSVYIRPIPMVDFNVSNSTLCLSGNNFAFTNMSTGISHFWVFGDGQTSTSNSPSHSYTSANTYNVKLITSSAYNCKDSITKTVSVNAEPTAPTSITGNTTICSGNTTILTASGGSEGSGCSYQWGTGSTVGLNIISSATSASYSTPELTSNTTYWVRRVGASPCSNTTAGVSKLVTINTAPTAPTSITGTTTICNGNTTMLTASGGSEGSGCSYQWGTGSTVGLNIISGATSASYTTTALNTNTTYWVRRVGTTPCSNTTTGVSQLITVNTAPTAPTSITGTTTICNGNTTMLTASGGSEGSGCSYQWGTGSTVGLNIISGATSASYSTPGLTSNTTYWVRRVGASPCSNTTTGVSQLITVNTAPTAPTSITGTTTICNGNTTMLTASGGSEGSGCSYQWGTGSTVGLNIISGATSASYSTPGLTSNTTYWVRRVGASPCSNTTAGVSKLVTVNTAPTAPTSITGTTTICNGNTTMLTASGGSENSGCTYEWGTGSVVGSNIISGATNANYTTNTLTTNTTYWVRRVGITPCSITTTGVTKLIEITTPPIADFNISDTSLCLSGNNFIFTNTSTGSASQTWSFSNGVTKIDNVLNFDGINDYVSVPSMPNPSGSFTIEANARMASKGNRTIVSKIENDWHGYTISYNHGADRMECFMGSGSPNTIQSQAPWNLNQWYHVALVYDASTQTMSYYQDGILQGSLNVSPIYSSQPFKIGEDFWGNLWHGDIDEVRVFNKARTLTEIQNSMNVELYGSENGLTNYYNFNQGIAENNNSGIPNIVDAKGVEHGSFINFALNGSISNFKLNNFHSIQHSFTTSGSFDVKMVINSTFGCSDSITKTIYVRPQPTAIYSVSDTSLCLNGNNFAFTNTSTGTSNAWNFGDGLISNSTSPNHSYASAGTYSVKLITSSASNCIDSITKNITVRNNSTSSTSHTACDSYLWNGTTYTTSGDKVYHTTNALGCDSAATLHLTINHSNTGIDVKTACGSYTWIDGVTYTSSNNIATHTLTNAAGCDSVVTLNLTINHSNTGIDVKTACDSYTWIDGVTYTSSNNIATHTLTNAAGCDSVVTLNLTINHSNTGIDVKTACDSYTWIDGVTYTSSNNIATHTLTNAAGCDSVVTLNLTINHSNTGIDVKTACDSYTWIDGVTYTSSNNTATHTLTNGAGCDSVVTLNLTINHSNTGIDVKTACDSYTWIDGVTYTSSNNTATHTLTNGAGCDSVVTLNLTINHSNTGIDVKTACDSYTWIDGVTYTSSNNTATHTLTNAAGCDSVVTLNLTINHSNTGIDAKTACGSYTWIDGVTYTSSNNTATHTLTNAAGCDSVVTLNLTINHSNTGIDVKTACDSYTWIDGVTYTASNNTATHTLTNAAGCDSVVTLNLTINHSNTGIDVKTACDSYTWIDGATYTSNNNTATHTLTNAAGCDSVITLNLTINHSNTGIDAKTACDTYTWIDGNTYTASNNTATHTLTNGAGCDSVVTLNLTINHSNTGIDAKTACDTYTWIDGNTYTASNNTATHTLTNGAGCDSVVTLNLTINHSNTGIDVKTACDSYTWIDGATYTSNNNTATHTLTNAAGCDSVITLNLTINHSNTGIDAKTACGSYTWIDGVTYTSSNNTATHTLTNAAGCDSVVTLNLTINSADTSLVVSGLTITSQADGATYQWLNCANSFSPIQNQTSHDFVATINGSYAVEVTENGCTDTSFCVDITNVNIGNYQFANEINLYPNPTDGKVNIDFDQEQTEIKLVVRDITGKVIFENNYSNSNRISFNFVEPKGFYIVELSSNNEKAVFKLVKQ